MRYMGTNADQGVHSELTTIRMLCHLTTPIVVLSALTSQGHVVLRSNN